MSSHIAALRPKHLTAIAIGLLSVVSILVVTTGLSLGASAACACEATKEEKMTTVKEEEKGAEGPVTVTQQNPFDAKAKIVKIKSNGGAILGGTCVENNIYESLEACTVIQHERVDNTITWQKE
jgi:hypothetical protein